MYRYCKLTFSYSFFSVWTHILRCLAKLLHIPKRAKNAIFYRKFWVFLVFSFFSVCFGLFRNSLFRLFLFYTKTDRVSLFRLNWNKQETHPNSLKENIFGYFSDHLGLFQFVSVVTKQFCLFRLFRYRFETPKQTEIFSFWCHETNRNKRETDLVSVCFGSNRNKFLFVSRTP
jgi:hypothetical protein